MALRRVEIGADQSTGLFLFALQRTYQVQKDSLALFELPQNVGMLLLLLGQGQPRLQQLADLLSPLHLFLVIGMRHLRTVQINEVDFFEQRHNVTGSPRHRPNHSGKWPVAQHKHLHIGRNILGG